ncbi:tetratricopeptide repeat protein [Chloroflexi bacterium TSY]|nr:tetratricopeptide repeat protein [Chloroflexi bacterium TSY]
MKYLGCLACTQGSYPQAETYQQQALAIWQQMNQEPEIASICRHLGHALGAAGKARETDARRAFQQSLELATEHLLAPIALDICVGVTSLLVQKGNMQHAVELLTLAENHAAGTLETKEKARQLLAELTADLPAEIATAAKARGQALDLWEATLRLLEELREPEWETKENTLSPNRHHLPGQPTSFIGREQELAELKRLLLDEPTCRLLTLVGPGGIGKTRLALEAAGQVDRAFRDGVYFIGLASVSEPEFIVSAIAEGLNVTLQGSTEPKTQLLNYLRRKELLLVVDNFEHLFDGVDLLSEILAETTNVKLLATSREALGLQEEWHYPVSGFPVPSDTDDRQVIKANSAGQLFLQRAQRAYAGFAIADEDIAYIVRICQLVDGMPLGLELAATWVRSLTCQEIAEEIERNLDILTTSMRNIPERHRSLRTVFEQTWQRLSEAERGVLSKLSVFRGGCLREAAEQVAGATLPMLAALVDKSLLRRNRDGRYEIHELIRQFAEEQLKVLPNNYQQVQNLYRNYYATFLQERTGDLKGTRQKEILAEIAAEIDNVRTVWQGAIWYKAVPIVERLAEGLWTFNQFRGLLYEGEVAFQEAVTMLTSPAHNYTDVNNYGDSTVSTEQQLVGFLLGGQGWFRARRGRLKDGRTLMEQGISLVRQAKYFDKQKEAFLLMWLGYIIFMQGKYKEAEQVEQESLVLFSELGDHWGMANCLRLLATFVQWAGKLTQAEQLLQESLSICTEPGERSMRLQNQNLARIAIARGEYAQAKQYLNNNRMICQELDDQLGMAFTLRECGNLAMVQGEYGQAYQFIRDSLNTLEEIGSTVEIGVTLNYLGSALNYLGNRKAAKKMYNQSLVVSKTADHQPSIANSLSRLGRIAYEQKEYDQAERFQTEALLIWTEIDHKPKIASASRHLGHTMVVSARRDAECKQYFEHALRLAEKERLAPIALDVLISIAKLLMRAGEIQRALALLSLVEHHSASTFEIKEKARQQFTQLAADLPTEVITAAKARGQALDLWEMAAQYENWCGTLAEELDVESGPVTAAVRTRIRNEEVAVASSSSHTLAAPSRHDLLEMPDPGRFYGREHELSQLKQWIIDDACRLCVSLGVGGVGKTSLTAKFVSSLLDQAENLGSPNRPFDKIFWRSLLNAPPLTDILRQSIVFLSDQQIIDLPASLDEQLRLLTQLLQQQRCLLILDNAESIMQVGQRAGTYRTGCEGYGQLIQRMAQSDHQSCLLLTSRESPQELIRLERDISLVRSLQLNGLPDDAAQQVLVHQGLASEKSQTATLVQRYSGHPLALKLVAETIDELYFGDVDAFLEEETLIFADISDVLDQQFARLSPLEQEILTWLAIEREPVSVQDLSDNLVGPVTQRAYLEALRGLQQRSLLEKQKDGFTLQNVIMEYTTDRFINQVCQELEQDSLESFNRHALLKAQAKDYVRESQRRLILQPIAENILAQFGREGVEQRCKDYLERLRLELPKGYAGEVSLTFSCTIKVLSMTSISLE